MGYVDFIKEALEKAKDAISVLIHKSNNINEEQIQFEDKYGDIVINA